MEMTFVVLVSATLTKRSRFVSSVFPIVDFLLMSSDMYYNIFRKYMLSDFHIFLKYMKARQ